MASTPPSELDKTLAAWCYWGNAALWFFPALVIFLLKKEDSPWVARHGLQSLYLSAGVFLFMIVSGIGLFILYFIPVLKIIGFLLMPLLAFILMGYWVSSAILGLAVIQDKDPNFPFLSQLNAKIGAKTWNR